MILRKPYAMMIKYFKIIHLIILGCLLFIEYNFSGISSLVNTLINTRTYTYSGADVYINMSVFIFIGVSLFLSVALFWLLRIKNKPSAEYLWMMIYIIVCTGFMIYLYYILNRLMAYSVESDTLTLIRDLLFMVRIPGVIFIGITLIRGIGFNIKQFNFSKDIEELQIVDKDSEEFEVMVGQNNYKYMRFLRRSYRELKYYIRENTLALMGLGVILVLVLGYFGVRYYMQYMQKVQSQQVSSINGIDYVVNNSYVTREDYNGVTIKDGYKYVVIQMSFNNTTNNDKTLNIDTMFLVDRQVRYSPTLTYNSKFIDMGIGYEKDSVLHPREMVDRFIVFELPDTTDIKNFELQIEYGFTAGNKNMISNFIKFDISPKEVDVEDKSYDVNINEIISTNVNNENKFDITVNGYSIQENYVNKFVICNRELVCQKLTSLITANNYNKMTMMVVDYNANKYDDAQFVKTFNTYNKILSNYAYVEYVLNGRTYTEKVNVVPNSDVEDKAFFLIDRKVLDASSLKLFFKFRNNTYIIPLKQLAQ